MKDVISSVLEHPIAALILFGWVGGAITSLIDAIPKVSIVINKKEEP